MRKTITYSTLAVAAVLVILTFVTATTYAQLGLAVVIYPLFAFFVLKVLPRKTWESPTVTVELEQKPVVSTQTQTVEEVTKEHNHVEIADIDKRAFLKLLGGAGVTLFLFSLFNKKSQVPFLGKLSGPDSTTLKSADGSQINPAERQPLDGYQISEIDDDIVAYYGFINKEGGWVIMKEDSDTISFRYAKGDSDFPGSWSNRQNIAYDYFHNIF